MSARAIPAALAVISACALAAAGCGGEDPGRPSLTPPAHAGEGGALAWAVAGPVRSVDPLSAESRAAQILTRQIHEPLVASLAGPFGEGRRRPGLALRARSSDGDRVWTLDLRDGVRFQDGRVFDAAAVLANAQRWLTTHAGQELLPGLVAVDAPSPTSVRFILAAPDPDLPRRLAAPQLGIVSPRAIAAGIEVEDRLRGQSLPGTGTGPFELREVSATELLLARNTAWWGSAQRLGPALEQVILRIEPSAPVRLALLDAGEVQAADELDAKQAEFARENPLLTALAGPGGKWLALERSVRGIDSGAEIPALSEAWITTVSAAD